MPLHMPVASHQEVVQSQSLTSSQDQLDQAYQMAQKALGGGFHSSSLMAYRWKAITSWTSSLIGP